MKGIKNLDYQYYTMFVSEMLKKPLRDQILETVASYHKMPISELCTKKQHRPIVKVRQQVMYFLRKETDLSLREIGETFGGKHHTTTMHAIKMVEDNASSDKLYRAEISGLIPLIKALVSNNKTK